jgi:hypothetical protein
MSNTEIVILVILAIVIIAVGIGAYVLTVPPGGPVGGSGNTVDTSADSYNPLASDTAMSNPDAGTPPPMPSFTG